jgi:hypothetical protein
MISIENCKALAVRYEAYVNATDHDARCLWAYMLREIQDATGVVLIEHLDYYADRFGRGRSSFTQETGIVL